MIKLSFLLLFLTIPLLGGKPVWGVPLWVWGSLTLTLLYAVVLLFVIERRWDSLKESEDG